ncbi:citrate synthase/methylcitrate synthase [Bacillus salitolerans]|uniref:Citrate synthase n=1 Tax=Bacillus salitolerans TaxID=1437434 RepID=A0ABW4LUN9_9BACI
MMNQGLKGVVAAQTMISHIDGENGILLYRGFEIRHLTKSHSFEEIVYLLWYGEIPTPPQLQLLKKQLKAQRELPPIVKNIIKQLPVHMDMMSVIRTAISSLGTTEYGWKPTVNEAITLTALVPSIIAFRNHQQEGTPYVAPNDKLDHVANYLYMLTGEIPARAHVDALETYMILTLEHGMNASTFSARVTASTESEIISAITSAIGTMKGPLHGGAPAGVIDLLDEIGSVNRAKEVLKAKVQSGEKLMGFGHRVYKTHDPRSVALREKLLQLVGEDAWLDLALHVENTAIDVLQELKPGRALYTNVEFYAAAIMKAIHMKPELFTPTFTASRVVGWTAHVLEQAENNTIYRPQSEYIGDRKHREQ